MIDELRINESACIHVPVPPAMVAGAYRTTFSVLKSITDIN
jgi:hypothetical protein